jgi:large subunit ribosomal protein L13
MLIDAKDLIVGRLGSVVAKQALLGEKIDIINADKAVISGKRQLVLAIYRQKAARGTWAKGPHYVRSPEMLLKRLIRDMLPYKNARGIAAYDRIMCWEGVPEEFKDKKAATIKEADVSKLPTPDYLTIKEISKSLGGKVD